MSQGRLIVAVDFGTTTFRALVTEVDEDGGISVVGCAEEPAQGFHDGDFVDLGAGAACVSRLIGKVEQAADIFVSGFAYNISGSHLRSVRSTAQLPIGPAPMSFGVRLSSPRYQMPDGVVKTCTVDSPSATRLIFPFG